MERLNINILKPFIVIIACYLLGACVPYPHSVRKFPEIHGVYRENGQPKEGIKIRYKRGKKDGACSDEAAFVVTDAEGRFSVPAGFERSYFLVIGMVHIYNAWNLCFRDGAGNWRIWSGSSYGPEEAPEMINIECDTSLPEFCR